MKKLFAVVISLIPILTSAAQNQGNIPLLQAKFITGNNPAYSAIAYDDSNWEEQQLGQTWQSQRHPDYHGYAWYRIHLVIPSSLKKNAFWKDSLRVFLAHVNDVDETFLNGKMIGHTGSFPDQPEGYISKWPAVREYHISLNETVIRWDKGNVIAVKVFDGGGTGGIFMGSPYVDVLEKVNGLNIALNNQEIKYDNGNAYTNIKLSNQYGIRLAGTLHTTVVDELSGKTIKNARQQLYIRPFAAINIPLLVPDRQGINIHLAFIEQSSKLQLNKSVTLPYILTPATRAQPVIHSPDFIAFRLGHPLIYKIPVTGKKPLAYSAMNIPAGLKLDENTGLLTGTLTTTGDYTISISAKNISGFNTKMITIKVGDTLALTPPMGWNSWNCWGTNVSDERVRSSVQSLIDMGLADHGWNYINVDDGWQARERAGNGILPPNEKFPDMKKLGNFLHGRGLRFGIYSSPGTHTCGGFLGSFNHEMQDANMYAGWGIDYLKYDLCSYIDSMKNNVSVEDHQRPYKIMRDALAGQNRDILYSICQYGIKDVWKWGRALNGNLWRTTEDIEDTWQSMYDIGFKQDTLYPYAGPGGWNDPDMLTVGMVGWGQNLHPTRLTADEQYTQMSLWSMLSAPLLIGCDLSKLDKFTLNLLTNDEVIGIDQDRLGRQAKKIIDQDSIQVWVKDLSDGSKAISIFNLNSMYKTYRLPYRDIQLSGSFKARDLWRQQNIPEAAIEIKKNNPATWCISFQINTRS